MNKPSLQAMEMSAEAPIAEDEAYRDNTQYSETTNAAERKVIKTAYLELEVGEGKFEKTLFEI